jgi:hypothetical protein
MKKKINNRLIDTVDTVAITPISSRKEIEIEDLNMTLEEYLNSLKLDDDVLPVKSRIQASPIDNSSDFPEDLSILEKTL